jgi:hypothetical protein
MRKTLIGFKEGNYTTYDNVTGQLTRIYSVVVPKNEAWELDPMRPFVIYFLCKDLGLVPSATTDGTVTTSNNILVPTTAAGSSSPVGSYEILIGTVGGVKQRLTVTNRTTNTLTFSGTVDTGTTIDAFYIPDVAAQVQLRIEDPRTLTTLDQVFLSEDPSILMTPNPYHENTWYGLRTPFVVPSDYMLSLWIKASYPIAWQDTADTPADLPIFFAIPIVVYNVFELPEDIAERTQALMLKNY